MPVVKIVGLVYFAIAFAVWLVGAHYFLIVARELKRVRENGGLTHIPRASRGLPNQVIFTNQLPRVERERRRLVFLICAFVALCLAVPLKVALFGAWPF